MLTLETSMKAKYKKEKPDSMKRVVNVSLEVINDKMLYDLGTIYAIRRVKRYQVLTKIVTTKASQHGEGHIQVINKLAVEDGKEK